MNVLLFRKIVVDGINYYQLFEDNTFFNNGKEFGNYDNRDSYDYFYIDKDSDIVVPDESLYNIYCDGDKGLEVVSDFPLYDKVSHAFNDKFHYFSSAKKDPQEIINSIKKNVLFQDSCIENLVEQIYSNQSVVNSDLPDELKIIQKSNILFHGKVGSGKKNIVKCLEKELDIPYADITIGNDVKRTLEEIIKTLLSKSNNEEEASRGIVFIHDNYDNLVNAHGKNLYEVFNFLMPNGIIDYNGKNIDFRTITYVILLDDYPSTKIEEIQEFQDIANCTCRISTSDLSYRDKYNVLFSPNGRLSHYEKYLKSHGINLIIDPRSLIEIIIRCSRVDPNMTLLNSTIDNIIRLGLADKTKEIRIDQNMVNRLKPVLDFYKPVSKKSEDKNDEFWFEKKVDEITEKTKESVVEQDRCVKTLVYQLVDNLRAAYNNDLKNPKDQIMNILVRGNSGSGKTFLVENVLKNLGVPYFTADATDYTGTGWVGSSVSEMLTGLLAAADGDLEKAQRGVLFIDEIDKKAKTDDAKDEGPGKGMVQEALYKLAEGSIIKTSYGDKGNEKTIYFDTSRLTIVIAGAFEGIEKIRNKRLGLGKLGFGGQDTTGLDLTIIPEDYISYGMTRQFMRRVNEIIEVKEFTKEQLISIMKNSSSSALISWYNSFLDKGIELEYTEDFYGVLADKALELNQGVSSIRNRMVRILQSIDYQDIRPSEVEKIILTGEVVDDPTKVILVPRTNKILKKK